MKKLFLLSFAIIAIISSSFAQITLLNHGTEDPLGESEPMYEYGGTSGNYFDIKNEGSSEINIIVEVTTLSLPDGAALEVCACGSCVTVGVLMTIGNPTAVTAGSIYNESYYMYHPAKNEQATFTLKVWEEGNMSNYDEVVFDTGLVGINSYNTGFYVYPNPVSEYLFIQNSDYQQSYVSISNIIGQEVKRIKLTNEKTKVDMTNLKDGVYIYTLYSDEKIIMSKKLIKL